MQTPALRSRSSSRGGFTLVEMMVTIGIIALLLGILLVGLRSAMGSGDRTREISNLRQLYYAWQMYSSSNDEAILPGVIDENVQELWKVRYRDARGNDVLPEDAVEYPWRLAAYTDYSWQIFSGYRTDFLEDLAEVPQSIVATEPAFGYNAIYIGGEWTATSPAGPARLRFDSLSTPGFNNLVARTQGAIIRPDQQVIFSASALREPGFYKQTDDGRVPGSARVSAPFLGDVTVWRAGVSGNPTIDVLELAPVPLARYGQAVASLLGDGSAQPLGVDALQDMRRWVNAADSVAWQHPAK